MHERLYGIVPPMITPFRGNLRANVKHCLSLQGRQGGLPRAPMPETSTSQGGPIRQVLSQAGVLAPHPG